MTLDELCARLHPIADECVQAKGDDNPVLIAGGILSTLLGCLTAPVDQTLLVKFAMLMADVAEEGMRKNDPDEIPVPSWKGFLDP